MKIYLVGGALRDKFLNIPVKDKDFVVVGSSPEEMIKNGFKPIGKDFPVFLHPETKEEYALARTEKKIGVGYHGFKFYTSPQVSLEEDLKRRDLTINAIAQDENGKIYDPYNGQIDIKKRVLRHVSDAFIEDPLRILRAARISTLDKKFEIHKDTLSLLKKMVSNGELKSLPIERVLEELKKGLAGMYPSKMFYYLCECDVLNQIFPGINADKKLDSNFVALGHTLDKKIVNVATEFRILLVLLIPYFSESFIEDENNLLRHLKLSNTQKKVYEALKSEKDNLDNFLTLKLNKKLDCLYRLDFFRRPKIIFEILNMLMILSISKNESINLDSSNNFEANQEDFIKGRSKLLQNITKLLEAIIELSTKEKKSFESVMNGDQIKKQIYEDRLLILKKLEAE